MSPKVETYIARAAAIVFIAIIILTLLCSCKTKTITVTETITLRDTVRTYHTDTIRDVKVTHHTDTVRQIETHTFTLNDIGDTIKEIHHYHDFWHTTVIDSTYRYKSLVDSLQKALREAKDKNTVIVKRYPIPWWLIVTFVVVITAATIIALVKRKGNK